MKDLKPLETTIWNDGESLRSKLNELVARVNELTELIAYPRQVWKMNDQGEFVESGEGSKAPVVARLVDGGEKPTPVDLGAYAKDELERLQRLREIGYKPRTQTWLPNERGEIVVNNQPAGPVTEEDDAAWECDHCGAIGCEPEIVIEGVCPACKEGDALLKGEKE